MLRIIYRAIKSHLIQQAAIAAMYAQVLSQTLMFHN